MKKIILILFLLVVIALSAIELDDLKFASGLYADGNIKLAKIELESFIDHYPNSLYLDDANYLLANALFQSKEFGSASKIYLELYESNTRPTLQAELILGLAQCYYFQKDFTKAERLFIKFYSEFTKHDKVSLAYFYLGKIQESRLDYQAALEFYDQALSKANLQRSQVQAARMKMLIQLGNSDEADQLYEMILRESIGSYRDYTILLWIESKLQNRDYKQVLERGLRRIQQKSDNFQQYKMLLGICYYELADYAEAIKFLENLINPKARYYYALAISYSDLTTAKNILTELQSNEDENIAINSQFYLAQFADDPEVGRKLFTDFIKRHPKHKFIFDAYYQLGYKHFIAKDYNNSKFYLEQAEAGLDDPINLEKLHYLLAETYYQLNQFDLADKYFDSYVNNTKNKMFRDEAIYKQALQYYAQKDLISAILKFREVIKFTNSDKVGISYFYLGDIYLLQNKLSDAKNYYQEASKFDIDAGFLDMRLAKISVAEGDLDTAINLLDNLPVKDKYRFDQNLLHGNISVIKNNYPAALEHFIQAEKYTGNDEEIELIISRKAWTLYQMKQFEQSAKYYQQLSGNSAAADQYIFKAANAAFSAENYDKAIELYTQYIENFDQKKGVEARIAIADSYYNLQNYEQAIIEYRNLFDRTEEIKILDSALRGIRWCSLLLDDIKLDEEIDRLMSKTTNKQIIKLLLSSQVNYFFESKDWSKTVKAVDQLLPILSEEQSSNFILISAISYAQLEEIDVARKLFIEVEKLDMSAKLYYNWAIMELNANDKIAAITILKKGISISERTDLWLKLLELNPKDMDKFYHQFIDFAESYPASKATIFWIKWKMDNGEFDQTVELTELKKSNHQDIKANAQYLLGYGLYNEQKYDLAIRELLRVRYLYPDINDIRIEAEYLACVSYIESGKIDDAKQLFQTIQAELPEKMRTELQKELSETE